MKTRRAWGHYFWILPQDFVTVCWTPATANSNLVKVQDKTEIPPLFCLCLLACFHPVWHRLLISPGIYSLLFSCPIVLSLDRLWQGSINRGYDRYWEVCTGLSALMALVLHQQCSPLIGQPTLTLASHWLRPSPDWRQIRKISWHAHCNSAAATTVWNN